MSWKQAFNIRTLKQGQTLFAGDMVILSKVNGMYSAMVRDGVTYSTYIKLTEDDQLSGFKATCNCPDGSGRAGCRHMAAALFAIEAEHSTTVSSIEGRLDFLDTEPENGTVRYFDVKKIFSRVKYDSGMLNAAFRLIDDPSTVFGPLETYYESYSGELTLSASASFNGDNATVYLTKERVEQHVCRAVACTQHIWSGYSLDECRHTLALLIHTLQEIVKTNPGDETDRQGDAIINAFLHTETPKKQGLVKQSGTLHITPRLIIGKNISVQFKVASGGGRAFLIKNLHDFAEQLRHSGEMTFGKNTVITLNRDLLDDTSLPYFSFLENALGEEDMFSGMLSASTGNTLKPTGQNLALFGKRLDDFFFIAEGERLDAKLDLGADNDDVRELKLTDRDPDITMYITPKVNASGDLVSAVCSFVLPVLFRGQKRVYFYERPGLLCRSDERFLSGIGPFINENTVSGFTVGRNRINTFFHNVLPKIREVMNVEFTDEDRIRENLCPEALFEFYLDNENGEITCRVVAVYGDARTDLTDDLSGSAGDIYRESRAVEAVKKYLPVYREDRKAFTSDGDEEMLYELLLSGIDELNGIGAVHATDAFSSVKLNRKVSASVGISVESGIMELQIGSEDLSQLELKEILESYRAKKKYHRLKNGDFISLENDTVEMLDEMMQDLNISLKEFVKGKMNIPSYRALYLDKMLEEHQEVYAHRSTVFRKIVSDFRSISDSEFAVPKELEDVLRGYQKAGYKWLRTLETFGFGGILADDMGLGKTVQVLSMILAAKQEGRPCSALVVCPASLVFNWGEEIRRFTPSLSFTLITGSRPQREKIIENALDSDICITSYDLLKRDIELYENISWTYEILDEAQYIKNQTTSGAKSVKLIKAANRFALTGTPIENRLSELWSIFDYLMPGFLYGYDTFRKQIETPAVKYHDTEVSGRLKKMTGPFILRRLKEDVLQDLPEKVEETVYAAMELPQRHLYDAQVLRLQEIMEESSNINEKRMEILTQLLRLRQLCCAPSLCYENYDEGNAKLDACMQLVENAIEGSHKILLFSQFTSMLDLIKPELDRRSITYYELTGATPKETRLELVKAFNNDDTPVFLISLKAGGTGLNLIGADIVIHYDPWWNVAVQNQATDRAHRIGQTRNVTVYKLIAKDTIEEKIELLQKTKKDLADNILSGENVNLAAMSREELLSLIGK